MPEEIETLLDQAQGWTKNDIIYRISLSLFIDILQHCLLIFVMKEAASS